MCEFYFKEADGDWLDISDFKTVKELLLSVSAGDDEPRPGCGTVFLNREKVVELRDCLNQWIAKDDEFQVGN